MRSEWIIGAEGAEVALRAADPDKMRLVVHRSAAPVRRYCTVKLRPSMANVRDGGDFPRRPVRTVRFVDLLVTELEEFTVPAPGRYAWQGFPTDLAVLEPRQDALICSPSAWRQARERIGDGEVGSDRIAVRRDNPSELTVRVFEDAAGMEAWREMRERARGPMVRLSAEDVEGLRRLNDEDPFACRRELDRIGARDISQVEGALVSAVHAVALRAVLPSDARPGVTPAYVMEQARELVGRGHKPAARRALEAFGLSTLQEAEGLEVGKLYDLSSCLDRLLRENPAPSPSAPEVSLRHLAVRYEAAYGLEAGQALHRAYMRRQGGRTADAVGYRAALVRHLEAHDRDQTLVAQPMPSPYHPNCKCVVSKETEDMSTKIDRTTSADLPFGLFGGKTIVKAEFSDGGKSYAYFADDDLEVAVGDYVVVASPFGSDGVFDEASGGYLKVVRITDLTTDLEGVQKAAKWIVSKVDVDGYRDRRAKVEQAKLLDAQIEQAKAEAIKTLELQSLMDLSPELKRLVAERLELSGVKLPEKPAAA